MLIEVAVSFLVLISALTNVILVPSKFFNYGKEQNLTNDDRDTFFDKSKIEVLGDLFKKNIEELKTYEQLDVVFLIDSSSSVGEGNFQSEIRFVKKLLSDVDVDYNHTRIAIVTFSSKSFVVKRVDEITRPRVENDKCLLLNKELDRISYIGGGTYTLGAFQRAKEIFERSRNDSKKVLFLITDGFSNGGDPVPLANSLKETNVTIFTIGIKNGNYKELYDLSTTPGEHYSYLLDSFQEFESLARRALHVDIKSTNYIPLGSEIFCNSLCSNGSCCDHNALCTCDVSSGHYTCLCQPGYYGSGLTNSCTPCPSGTYSEEPNLCLPCPNIHHITTPPANGIESCKCKSGYRPTKNNSCETIKCKKLLPPKHGYFVKRRECGNILNNACGVRCEVGYTLTGSSIRLCQIDATWSGTPPTCQIKTCSALPAPLHGSISCHHGDLGISYNQTETNLPVDTMCTFKCKAGRVLAGSPQRTCLPVAQWDGLKTTCKQVKCNKLSAIQFGSVEPKSCTTHKQNFGSNCTYSCQTGFAIKGPKKRTCTGRYGRWSQQSAQSVCEDVTPPELACPKNLSSTTLTGQNYGNVLWLEPKATDNSGLEVKIWIVPAIEDISTHKFEIGKTEVTYFARDPFENVAQCSFTVEIIDNEAPIIENCIDPLPFLTTGISEAADISWDEPNIFDNSHSVMISKSKEFGAFPIGLTLVTYTAVDPFNNTNICVINVTVEESRCVPLPSPSFGNSNCSSLGNGIKCVITCHEGYAIPLQTGIPDSIIFDNLTQLACENANPSWTSQDEAIYPDCTVTQLPEEILQKGVFTVDTEDGHEEENICQNIEKLNELENEIQNNLNRKLLGNECELDGKSCVNTSTVCVDRLASEIEEEKTNIIKRHIYALKPKRRRRNKIIKVDFEVKTKFANGNRELLSLSKLESAVNGTGIKVMDVFLESPKAICPLGYIPKKLKCVQCPKGTFYNTSENSCQSCALGFYSDKFGQTSCTICPLNHSTTKMRSKSLEDCKAVCPPGTHSRRKRLKPTRYHPNTTIDHVTLMPYCRSCPLGTYQSNYGQLSCRECPEGYTTLLPRSNDISKCVQVESITKICDSEYQASRCLNNGTCIQSAKTSFSCQCSKKYVGSRCEIKLNGCSSNPCLNEGICISNFENKGYSCSCKDGYSGEFCENVRDNCTKMCFNNGTCIRNEDDIEECFCEDGFAGPFCEIGLKFCRENLCENGGQCVEETLAFRCLCRDGFIGHRCNIVPCDYQPCPQTHLCVNVNETKATRKSYRCECPKGLKGSNCSEKINFCESEPCFNGGTCLSLEENFECRCSKIFRGQRCEFKRDGNFILHFPRSGTTDFVKMDGFSEKIREFTLSFWLFTKDDFNYGTILSYANHKYDNALTLTDYTGLVLYVNGQHFVTNVLLNDGLWHFVAITWKSTGGSFSIYVDSKKIHNGTGLASEESIEGYGKFVVGQEQDVLGGRFSQSESFLGNLTFLEIWKRALNESELLYIRNSCTEDIFGDVYAWAEMRDYVHGDVEIVKSTFCKTCPELDVLYHGLIEVIDNVAYYKCHAGFQLSIPSYTLGRKCTKASKWEGLVEPECKKIFCGYPGYVAHGKTVGNDYYYTASVKYICDTNYTLQGSEYLRCTKDGFWYPQKPECIGIQCTKFTKPSYSEINIINDLTDDDLALAEKLDVGSQIEIWCINDTKLEGESLLTCLDNGTWDYPIPKCRGKFDHKTPTLSCLLEQLPSAPINGYVVVETVRAYEMGKTNTVEYKCRQGYQLNGGNKTVCILDGYWTELKISCTEVICENPKLYPNMKLKINNAVLNNTYYTYGNMVTLECVDGYKYFGNKIVRCQSDGTWNRILGKCLKKSCFTPKVRKTTTIEGDSYLFMDQVKLKCKDDNLTYALTCDSSGNWLGKIGDSC